MSYNEEMIKNNLVLPLLKDIGLNEGEIEFETNFTIRLGRGVYNLKNEDVNTVKGRLDILCKRDGKNIFILELKAEGVSLTEDDKKQGISYARLLDQMAPYVIVTNGKKTVIYDTYTGEDIEELNKDRLIKDYIPTLDEELRIRLDALKNFIGYSYDNLRKFCVINNKNILKKFCSDSTSDIEEQLKYKYIKDIYVQRQDLQHSFNEFLMQTEKTVFAIIGASGVGKTNLMCYLADNYNQEPYLFYSGSILGKSLFKEIVADFNMFFSSQETELNVFKKIASLSQIHNKNFIIFIDAIDEWIAHDKVLQINKLVKYTSALNIRLCISCNDFIWDEFTKINDVTSDLNDNLFYNTPKLVELNKEEFLELANMCHKTLGIELKAEDITRIDKNPFNIRVAYEVAYYNKTTVSIDSRVTLMKYLDSKFKKSPNKDLLYRFIDGISECILVEGKNLVHEKDIRRYIKLNINEDIPKDLYRFNILYKYMDDVGNVYNGFYFSKIRDYIIAARVLALDSIYDKEKKIKKIIEWLPNNIGVNAISYYFMTGNEQEQREVIEAIIKYDLKQQGSLLTKFLSRVSNYFSSSLKGETYRNIADHIKYIFKQFRNNSIVANEAIQSFKVFIKSEKIEQDLIEEDLIAFFEIILDNPEESFASVSSEIADILKGYDSKAGTERLCKLVRNKEHDDYVRRYIVESLSMRQSLNKTELFLDLICDTGGNVRTWVRGWYKDIEDIILRDQLLSMLDNINNTGIEQDIVVALSYSKLKSTGEGLFQRLISARFDSEVLGWMCRGLASMNYRDAIPTLINLLKENAHSRLGGQILISLGDYKAKEALEVIMELLLDAELKDTTWLTYAFSNIASEEDYAKLIKKLDGIKNNELEYLIALVLAKSANIKKYCSIIFSTILNKKIKMNKRISLLDEWALRKIHTRNENSEVWELKTNNIDNIFEPSDLELLYKLVEENNKISTVALGLIVSFENNVQKLNTVFVQILVDLREEINPRRTVLIKTPTLEKFATLIRPWLNQQLYLQNYNECFIKNCLIFCAILGDDTTLEAINDNKSRITSTIDSYWLDEIEQVICYSKKNEMILF
ncbi:HEAT repeat domain-containing protein [Alkaliphilus oremlandii]|uniref:Type I restriction enzyme R protein N-terminal domain-containing protein n=1 Tax=Alkaliphilus oremlandii (strain OhILAs) TaxID=350688 RepID=A8MHX5_ALKOO|nr:HEAT repeat domain-containing protein [Alkaliphilus oremlandii]ABW19407.1 protein of unknown function DUF450 [Alkaliphilus oremlandii OhILAs]